MNDRRFRVPRVWSNRELERVASLFKGEIVNVSGWKDIDKEGRRYRDYFLNADEYHVSNYVADARGFQGDLENEFFLDLTKPVDPSLKFDVVFNHTVLEHVYEVHQAFSNLCDMSNDIVIVVLPFIQEEHADYGDYWRFTPQVVDKLFQANGLETIYVNYNQDPMSSVYVFAIGSRKPEAWSQIRGLDGNRVDEIYDHSIQAGRYAVAPDSPGIFRRLRRKLFSKAT